MFLLSISDLLENCTRKKTGRRLRLAWSINKTASGGWKRVAAPGSHGANPPGEKIRVDAGNVIPVDGTVLSGEAEVNQAAMTGESEAASKREGSVVFAGTTLETGSLVIRVDAAGDQSRINNIHRPDRPFGGTESAHPKPGGKAGGFYRFLYPAHGRGAASVHQEYLQGSLRADGGLFLRHQARHPPSPSSPP